MHSLCVIMATHRVTLQLEYAAVKEVASQRASVQPGGKKKKKKRVPVLKQTSALQG